MKNFVMRNFVMRNFVMKKKIFVLMLVMILVVTGLSAQTYKKINYLDAPFYGMYDGKVVVYYYTSKSPSPRITGIKTSQVIDASTKQLINRYFGEEIPFINASFIKWDATSESFYKFMKKEGKKFYFVEY